METDEREQRVFAALADPTRRRLIERLSAVEARTATEFANELPITRQGVSKHLKILEEAGLVAKRQEGRERLYSLTPQPLADTVSWVASVTEAWDRRLAALYDYLTAEADEGKSE
jgi:DNA-binding transcriptional ArsR family regulator